MTIEYLHRKLSLLAISAMHDESLVIRKTQNGEAIKNTSRGQKPKGSRKMTYVQPSLFD